MRKVYYILLSVMVLCVACELKLKPNSEEERQLRMEVRRYDRLESRYLTTGDFSALQQMNTGYPMETRTLIENMLRLGEVDDPEINSKFLNFYQDTTLQSLIADAEIEFANMDDVSRQLSDAFDRLAEMLPGLPVPMVYSQIGALGQSIVVGEQSIGISLDKYLGEDYGLYGRFYTAEQRKTMTRSYIVPDCLVFYLLSLYPLEGRDARTQYERDVHMGKMMWVTNKALRKSFFKTPYVERVGKYMHAHPQLTVEGLLGTAESAFLPSAS